MPLTDARGQSFRYALPNVALEMLHQVDRNAAGKHPRQRSGNESSDARHISLQINCGRGDNVEPADDPDGSGRFRRADEDIVVDDETGTRLHTPPPADQLADRMRAMCDFANGVDDGEFMPPAVRAILLHLWLAYDHPFVDGNGRTARALYYWSMAREGYWLCEYVSISRILKKARGQYARSYLYTESDENDATYFILYQLRVLLRAIEELHQYLARKSAEMHEAEELVRRASAIHGELNPRQLALINHALKRPDARYTVDSHRRSHGVSYGTARSDLMRLAEQKLLDQRKFGRAFMFTPRKDLRARLEGRDGTGSKRRARRVS